MDEPTKRRWDVTIAAAAPLIAVAGLLLGAWQFSTKLSNDARLDFDRRLWLANRDACVDVADHVGAVMVALGPSEKELEQARLNDAARSFEQAYYGTGLLLDNAEVDHSANEFKRSLSRFQRGYPEYFAVKQAGENLVQDCARILREGAPDGERPSAGGKDG